MNVALYPVGIFRFHLMPACFAYTAKNHALAMDFKPLLNFRWDNSGVKLFAEKIVNPTATDAVKMVMRTHVGIIPTGTAVPLDKAKKGDRLVVSERAKVISRFPMRK